VSPCSMAERMRVTSFIDWPTDGSPGGFAGFVPSGFAR
jgi:hypothetical protein